jgi:hypothetical protein
MSSSRHTPTDQEMAQAERVEATRPYREQAAAAEAAPPADSSPAAKPDETPAKPGDDYGRVKVRGTKNDSETEDILRAFEKTVKADAAVNGGVVPPKASFKYDDKTIVRLTDDAPPPPAASDTETELNGLIAECRYLMREIAFNSARLTYDADDRIRFLASAQGLALTASKIGRTVAQIRAAGATPPPMEERRQRITVEHVQIGPRGGGTPSVTESAKQ